MSATVSNTTRPAIVILSSYAESLYNFRGDLIRKLIAQGWCVYALAPDYDAAKQARVEALGAKPVVITLQRNGMNLLSDFNTIVALHRQMRRIQPKIFFGYFMKPVIYGAIAAWIARVPRRVVMVAGLGFVFINADGSRWTKKGVLKTLVSALYWLAFRVSDLVIFQNRDDLSLMINASVAPADRTILVNGSGVNLERFTLPPAPRDDSRPLTFIWTGRLLREKGVVELVEAAKMVRDQGFDIEVILVGGVDTNPGSLTSDEVQAWHDAGLVTWRGKVDDVRPHLWQSDVFVLPSYREGLPRSTQEAMAAGLAIITTDAPGCRETIVDGENGILVRVRSATDIAEAMIHYAKEPHLAAKHGMASRKLAEQRFDVRIINQYMSEALLGTCISAAG